MERASVRLVAWVLAVAGGLFFVVRLGLLEDQVAKAALLAAAVVVLFHLARTVDPAWLITAGILMTMFAGNWDQFGLDFTIGPHRAVLAAGLLALVLRAPPARDRPKLQFGAVHLAMAAALGFAVVSAIAEGTLGNAAGQSVLIDQFGLVPFVLFTVAPVAFATEHQRRILLGGLVAAGAYLSITALLEKLKLYGLLVPSYIGDPAVGGHFGRARGPFVEAAANGFALCVCAAASAVAFSVWRRPQARLLAAAVVVLASIGILFTVTRAVWVAAAAGAVVALTTSPGLRRFLAPAAVAATMGVLGAFALIPGLADDASTRANDKGPVYERENTTAAGLRMVADRPFLGFGWWYDNAEMQPYYRQQPDIPLTGGPAGLHNVYLLYGVGLGLVGLGLWILAVALAFGGALSTRAPREIAPWHVALKAVFVAWLVIGVFGPANYAFATAAVWVWAGLVRPAREPAVERSGPLSENGALARVSPLGLRS